ncbi:MAG: amidoligase family protein, partial [Methylobacter sp.]
MRRVGVELEFSGLTLENIALLIREQFGGNVIANTPYESTITDTSLGDFKVELDFQYLKEKGRYKPDPEDFLAQLDEWSELI